MAEEGAHLVPVDRDEAGLAAGRGRGSAEAVVVGGDVADPETARRAIAAALEADLGGLPGYGVLEHLVLAHPDTKARNTREAPETVVPGASGDATIDGRWLRARLAPLSWNVVRLGRTR